jgi:hypothetical protein
MIYRIPPLPFSIADGDRSGNASAIPAGQGVDFLNLLVQIMAEINGKAGSLMADPGPAPPPAKKMLKSSGGDTATYLDLGSQRYLRLSTLRPETYAKYTKGWMNRVQNLRTLTTGNMNASTARAST